MEGEYLPFTVSIRDDEPLYQYLRNGGNGPFPKTGFPKAISHNADVLKKFLPFATRLLPSLSTLTEEETDRMLKSAAYLMRVDNLKYGMSSFDPDDIDFAKPKKVRIKNKFTLILDAFLETNHWGNDPSVIKEGWEVPKKYTQTCAELFRCFTVVSADNAIMEKISPHHDLSYAFILADVIGYLLNPKCLYDYNYSKREIREYRKARNNEEDGS